ncbi:hypothetical protein T484DRAFT_1810235 [Baffinella frigidus]|nr:hypothetical protein T484DRAFT_1810235 [Cryptophyta sp. CCMP2293]
MTDATPAIEKNAMPMGTRQLACPPLWPVPPMDDMMTRARSAPTAEAADSEREEQSPTVRADDEAGEKRTGSLDEVAPRRFVKSRRQMRRRGVSGPDDEMHCMVAAMSYAALARSQEPASSSPDSQLDAAEPISTVKSGAFNEQSSVGVGLGKRLRRGLSNDAQAFERCTSSADNSQAFVCCPSSALSSADTSKLSFARTNSSAACSDAERICCSA